MTLRSRLILAAAYLLTVVVIALEVPLAVNIDRARTSDFTSSVLSNAAIISAPSRRWLRRKRRSALPAPPRMAVSAAWRRVNYDSAQRLTFRWRGSPLPRGGNLERILDRVCPDSS